ncbi:unnamed protein product [Protopolystoma xenopodis]|uniref:Uncharacterized protein n=1 Tax=Protopolystoma xenopodis TaxID=117903 RepID=A0A448WPC7_9PLAT|nr:unnamed protein product [Protopolystoma xenopodis]
MQSLSQSRRIGKPADETNPLTSFELSRRPQKPDYREDYIAPAIRLNARITAGSCLQGPDPKTACGLSPFRAACTIDPSQTFTGR